MLHLALKAFSPGAARRSRCCTSTRPGSSARCTRSATRMADEHGARADRARQPEAGRATGINPFTHGSAVHTDVMKTRRSSRRSTSTASTPRSAARGATRRRSRAKERVFSFRSAQHRWDPKNQRPELWRLYNARKQQGRVDPRLPALELDRARRLAVHLPGGDPDRAALLRGRAAGRRARRRADHGRRRAHAARAGREAELRRVRFRTLGCYPLTGAIESDADTLAGDHRRRCC